MNTSGQNLSPWVAGFAMPSFQPLTSNVSTDVCIVGAGIAGISTAYFLSRDGKRVVVLDDGDVGGGETGRTTAHLVNALDDRYYELERLHGERGSQLAAESHSAAIDTIERVVHDEIIDCDFTRLDGYLWEPPEGDPANIDRELKPLTAPASRASKKSRAPRCRSIPVQRCDSRARANFIRSNICAPSPKPFSATVAPSTRKLTSRKFTAATIPAS